MGFFLNCRSQDIFFSVILHTSRLGIIIIIIIKTEEFPYRDV